MPISEQAAVSGSFLEYLRNLKFTGDIYAVPEGTPVFPQEPLLTVRAPAIEAQLVETYVLLALNHQSMIATKANRIVRAARGRTVLEFGSRRAQGADGAVIGARAAYIGRLCRNSLYLDGRPVRRTCGGTMAHSWIQMFDSEYEAFCAYCQLYPHHTTLLVDTYDTLKSGVPNAIRAFREVLVPQGITGFPFVWTPGTFPIFPKRLEKCWTRQDLPAVRSQPPTHWMNI